MATGSSGPPQASYPTGTTAPATLPYGTPAAQPNPTNLFAPPQAQATSQNLPDQNLNPQLASKLTGQTLGGPALPASQGIQPTPQAAAATLNPNQQYVDAFNASLAKMRGSIDSTLSANLGAMGHRRDLAAQTIAAGSKDVQQALSNQQAFNTTAAGNVDAGMVPGAAAGASANQGLYKQVIDSAKSTETGAAPLLQLGAQANYDTGAAQLQSAATTARSAIDQQQAQFAQQQASQQADYAHQAQVTQQGERFDLMKAGYTPAQIDAALSGKAGLPQLGTSSDAQWYQHANYTAGLAANTAANKPDPTLSKNTGGTFETQAQLQQFTHDPNYLWAVDALSGHAKGWEGQSQDAVMRNITTSQVIKALLATNKISNGQATAWVKAHPNA